MKRRGGKKEGRRESGKNQGTVAKFKLCILKPVLRALSLKETEREVRGRRFPLTSCSSLCMRSLSLRASAACSFSRLTSLGERVRLNKGERERTPHSFRRRSSVYMQVSSVVT